MNDYKAIKDMNLAELKIAKAVNVANLEGCAKGMKAFERQEMIKIVSELTEAIQNTLV